MATSHIVSAFDEELKFLTRRISEMGGLAEQMAGDSVRALISADTALAQKVISDDVILDAAEREIGEKAIVTIAKRQPIASDLRLILGISKIVTDLERSGDEAKKIAKGVRRIHEAGTLPKQYGIGIRHLAEAALSMVHQALDAFARMDGALALNVIRADVEVDVEFKSIIRQLITHMMEDPRTITTSIDIMAIARAIERIGDHAKNISEQVVYVVDGRDIRYDKGAIK